MMSFEFGKVVLIQFPQSETTVKKQRPGIVVLDIGDADVVIAPVTSKARSLAGDIAIGSLAGTRLTRPSWARLSKVAAILKGDVIRTLGRLSPSDRKQLAQV